MLTQRMRVEKKHRQGSGRFFRLFSLLGVCLFFSLVRYTIPFLFNAQKGVYLMFWKVLASMKTSIQDRRERLPLTHEQNRSKQNRK